MPLRPGPREAPGSGQVLIGDVEPLGGGTGPLSLVWTWVSDRFSWYHIGLKHKLHLHVCSNTGDNALL